MPLDIMNVAVLNAYSVAYERETAIMPLEKQAAESLKVDFLEWSGGFPPDSEQQIFVYVEYAAPNNVDEADVLSLLRTWMNEAATQP